MNRVIVLTDLSQRSEKALERAAGICREQGARLMAVHAVDDEQPEHIVSHHVVAAEEYLAKRESTYMQGIDFDVRVVTGDIFLALQREVESAAPDLVVAGDHRRGLARDLFGYTTVERLIRITRTPVLIARSPAESDYRRVLIGVEDGEAEELVNAADSLSPGCQVTILHALDSASLGLMRYAGIDRQAIEAHREELATEAVQRLRDTLPAEQRDRVGLRVLEKEPAAALMDEASQGDHHLIVVSSHARRGLARLMLGSVTSRLLREGTTDMLIVPSV